MNEKEYLWWMLECPKAGEPCYCKEECMYLRQKSLRELDALVAEKVMGWTYGHPCPGGMDCLHWADEKGNVRVYKPPQYSTDISAAWEVVGKIQNDYILDFKLERKYCVAAMKFVAVFEDLDGKKWVAHGWIAPEAICKAALLAVMGE